uniref:Ribosomal protein L20 n=1 Tax=Jakoba bahamiensis TaxID=221721 RepID=M4QD60_9EUKA|nr:ribosomal protein L20 [Jakoba bahamiensis]AGH24125.1 ribosomal protein L20 [Jakoba bahamiensis]
MIRVKSLSHKSHRNLLKDSKGYRGRSKNVYSVAIEKIEKARIYNYIHRKLKKRSFRQLYIEQINAFCRKYQTTYSSLLSKLLNKNILINRKMLSHLIQMDQLSARSLLYV